MPVRIQINPEQVQAKIMGAWQKNLFALTSQILQDCNQYVKRDIGTLETSSLIHSQPAEGKIIWQTPYARRQYWEIKTSLTPGRTWRWIETAKKKYKDRWYKLAQRGIKNNL